MKNVYLTLGLSLGPASAAWAAEPAPEAAKLQGTWRSVAAERDGATAPDAVGHRLAFAGDRFQITREGKLLFGGTYAADPAARPARVDFRQDEGAGLRGEWKGIYRFEAGRLEIVDNADDTGKPRPTSFATTPGFGYVLVRFEPK